MDESVETQEAFDAELARWAKYQTCSDALLSDLEPSMRDLVTNTLFCPPGYRDFVSERVESAVEDDDDLMDLLEETVEQVINEAEGDDAVNTDSFYDEEGSTALAEMLKEAGENGTLSTEMFLAMAKHSCMMVRASLGQQKSITPDSLQGLDVKALLGALRPQLDSPHSLEALAAADLMLRLGADFSEVEAAWKTWEAQERMNLAFLMLALHDSDIAYEYLGSLIGSEGFEDVAWELRQLATAKALAVIVAAHELVSGDMLSHYVCQIACMEVPESAEALQTLAESASAEMQQEAKDWQIRIQQRDAGVEEWLTLPTPASTSLEGVLDQGDEHPGAENPSLFGLVSPSEWSAFTDWLETQEGECDHDEESYNGWFSAKGLDEPAVAQKSEKLYEAMGEIAGTGSCACAASAGVFSYPAA